MLFGEGVRATRGPVYGMRAGARARRAPVHGRARGAAAGRQPRGRDRRAQRGAGAAAPALDAAAAPPAVAGARAATFDATSHLHSLARGMHPMPAEDGADDGSSGARKPQLGAAPPDGEKPNVKLEAEMVEANKAYDRGDTDEARDIAKRIVASQPGNVRMLRILVSTSCIDGDAAAAKQYYATLPKGDQNQMATRCARYGVTFGDPVQ